MSSSMAGYLDFVNNTAPAFLSDTDQLVNEAQRQTYGLRWFLRGRKAKELLQGGETIRETALTSASPYTRYKPNAVRSYTNNAFTTQYQMPWRFADSYKSWTDQEVMLQSKRGMTKRAVGEAWKKMDDVKTKAAWTGIMNGLEDDMFGTSPHNLQTSIEDGAGGDRMYPLLSLITEDTTDYHPAGWTTIHNVDPATESTWRNQVERYYNPDYLTGENSLHNAFGRMWNKINWVTPPMMDSEFTKTNPVSHMILTSNKGTIAYRNMLLSLNDRTHGPQSPWYPNPDFNGVPVLYVKALDTVAAYLTSSATYVAEDDSSLLNDGTAWAASTDWTRGPRFYWVDTEYCRPVFHDARYFTMEKAMNSRDQPETWTQRLVVWGNFITTSRQRLGVVGPGASQT